MVADLPHAFAIADEVAKDDAFPGLGEADAAVLREALNEVEAQRCWRVEFLGWLYERLDQAEAGVEVGSEKADGAATAYAAVLRRFQEV